MEKKSSTKDVDKGTDELTDMLLMDKKSSTNNVYKGTDGLADTLLMQRKSSTKYVDKGTDELAFMKQKVNAIIGDFLDHFEGQSIRSKGWFKIDIDSF